MIYSNLKQNVIDRQQDILKKRLFAEEKNLQ